MSASAGWWPVFLLAVSCSDSSSATHATKKDGTADAPGDAPEDAISDAASDAPSEAGCAPGSERNGPYSLLGISGNPGAKGANDPAVVYAEGADFGLMTFTTVPDEAHDHIAIATSLDSGATWSYTADVTQAVPVTISTSDTTLCGAATCDGTFIQESSSLALDPTDPDASRRLKVFVHSYFFGAKRHLELGYVAMHTAATPAGPWTETRLFGWDSSSPLSSTGVSYDITTDPQLPELHDCYIVGEPGVLFRAPDTLDLTLSCVVISGTNSSIDVRLVRSKDHGQTWSFVSKLLTPDDGLALGSELPEINGSALLNIDGSYHVIASPAGNVNTPGGSSIGYRGCVVVPIEDIESGTVVRCNGAPVREVAYLGQPGQFVGACSADVGASKNGMLIPVPDFSTPGSVAYRIFAAGLPLP